MVDQSVLEKGLARMLMSVLILSIYHFNTAASSIVVLLVPCFTVDNGRDGK